MKLTQYLGLTIVPVALIGTICNGLVVLAMSSNRSLSHSFSMLTGNQAVFDGLFSFICLIYVAPMIVFDVTFLKDNSHHVGFLLMVCYDVSIQTHALITVNRFCAVFLPMMYSKLFNTLQILLQRSITQLLPHGSSNLLGLFIIPGYGKTYDNLYF
ncbi:hypothetical protein GCK72_016824 [Caenorhabditis remanei]|uniref:7TM GPCR serpentine receptor class x (Srx) domain-containing protein n=1 Tax=Caenorhabditis remanei TaxID=31234 RepID=A0A6A5G5Q6_CAERE|nr:hypothetical protein GCK72_016824 [Caenorhabditis remanei]KAF1750277.1 hypothetical protein GCK72_016824 [Caenorhabditis remanei]